MYGLDGPALLLMPLLWLIVSLRPVRWLCAAALAADAVFLLALLGDTGWYLDPGKRWLHAALTVLPAIAVCVWTLPRGRREPAQAAALCALLNLYFAVVPHERVTLAVLAAALVPATAALLAVIMLPRPRVRLARVALRVGVAVVLLAALGVAAMTTSTVTGYRASDLDHARAEASRVPVRTGRVTTEGDDLHFEVRGSGPPLLMISGGQGDAGFFTYAAALLANEFQVVTYDRRGNSRSTRNATDFDLAQQARDALAVLRAAGHESAAVFGNSGGAIVALELAARHPDAVTAVIAHEPPAFGLEPDRKTLTMFGAFDRTARLFGPGTAMFLFALSVGLPFTSFQAAPDDFNARTAQNQDFFVEAEMQEFVRYVPDVAALKEVKAPVIPAVGAYTRSTNRYYGRPAALLAERLGTPLLVFPGHHMSYFDLPVAWTETLRDTLRAADRAGR